jgi:hypothetical protein
MNQSPCGVNMFSTDAEKVSARVNSITKQTLYQVIDCLGGLSHQLSLRPEISKSDVDISASIAEINTVLHFVCRGLDTGTWWNANRSISRIRDLAKAANGLNPIAKKLGLHEDNFQQYIEAFIKQNELDGIPMK